MNKCVNNNLLRLNNRNPLVYLPTNSGLQIENKKAVIIALQAAIATADHLIP